MDYLSENSNFSFVPNSLSLIENEKLIQNQPDSSCVTFENLFAELNHNQITLNNLNEKNCGYSNQLSKNINCSQYLNTSLNHLETFSQNLTNQNSFDSFNFKTKEQFNYQNSFNDINYFNQSYFFDNNQSENSNQSFHEDYIRQKNFLESNFSSYDENNFKKIKKTYDQNINQSTSYYSTNYPNDQVSSKILNYNYLNNLNDNNKKNNKFFTLESKENFSNQGFIKSENNFDFQLETIEIDGKKVNCLKSTTPLHEQNVNIKLQNNVELKNFDQNKHENQCLSNEKILIYDLDKKMYFCVEESIKCKDDNEKKDLLKKNYDKKKSQYVCNYCKRISQTKSLYEIHLRKHTGERPFFCLICYASFPQKSSLTRHVRSHTNEKPYDCDFCQKKFSDKNTLKIHRRIHTGEKPFFCSICFRQFTQKASLKRHLKVHELKSEKKNSIK